MEGKSTRIPVLSHGALIRAAALAGIGRKSGDLVAGLSAVRRSRDLALIVVESGISNNTLDELVRYTRHGTRVYQVEALLPLTSMFGRCEVRVIGVKRGPLAAGMMARLGVNAA